MDYKRWTDEQRNTSYYRSKQIIASGLFPAKPSVCEICGQTKGILEWHNENYDDPIKYLAGLCYRCHMAIHVEYRAPEAVDKYLDLIAQGFRFMPVYKRNFAIVRRDHGF